ncbi:TonB-dependent receptor [Halioxenophilus aromaticivorans]|uniref:TonB-dependent receptor n=1 Tax=Halioxenophilus aromaticivorans TaxID=1306992 RepID=A0AAV3U7K4_9ALTE
MKNKEKTIGLRPLSLAIACLAGQCVAVPALADGMQIEEVVVTAQKRAQSAQDIGVAVSAFAGDDIKKLNLDSATELASHTPGLSTANGTSGGTPIFAIRGIGLDDFNINNSSGVGVYVDEVFASSPMLLGFQLMDIERVEVLKGPQGTLYGKNTTGGAINFVSNKPSEDFSASITAGYSRWNRVDLDGYVNGALSDSVNGRVAYSYSKQNEGWQTDIDTGEEFGKVDKLAIRTLLNVELSPDTEMLVNLHYGNDESKPISPQNDNSEQAANDILGLGGLLDGMLDVPADSDSVRVGGLDVRRDETGYGASITIVHDAESLSFQSITAWESYEREVVDNYDGTAVSFLDLDQSGELSQYSQEFRLTSDSGDDYTWVLGANYSLDEVEVSDDFLMDWSAGINLTTAYEQVSASWGVYFHNEYYLTEVVKLTGGVRYSQDKREFDGGTFSTDGSDLFGILGGMLGSAPVAGTLIVANDASETEDNISGKIGLDYQISEDVLLYGNVSTSYKAGIFYGGVGTRDAVLGYVEPEEVTAYEIGFKTTLLDSSLQLNGAVYRYDYDNRQSLAIVEDPAIFLVGTLANVPESTIEGAELDFWWRAAEGLDFKGGVSYINSRVEKDLASADVRNMTLFSVVPKGASLSQSPEWSYNGLVSYSWNPSDNFIASIQLDYSWSDNQYAALSDPLAVYGPVKKVGTRLSLGSADEIWELALWADNIENENSDTYSFTNNSGARSVYRQQPVSYGVTFTYNFE